MPKVSVIIPIYNVEKYLRQCLDSVVNQTLQDIEIICVNDGSTDSSGKIAEEYAKQDGRIKVIHKENSGYGASMNIGLAASNAEYIGILESDDIAKPNMFEFLYNLAVKYDCEVVKSDFYLYYSKNNKLIKNDCLKDRKINKVTNIQEDIGILSICPSIWSAIYKKEFITNNNIRFLETAGASYQDTSFYHKVMLTAKRVFLTEEAFVLYRQDNENSSVNSKGKVYCIVDEYKEDHNFIEKQPELKQYEQYIYMLQFKGYSWNVERLSDKFKEEFYNYFYEEFKNYYDNKLLQNEFYLYLDYVDFDSFLKNPKAYYKKYFKYKNRLTPLEQIFSITNSKDKTHKIITIIGIKIKFRKK